MSKKDELPGVEGPGVSRLEIADIDKAIAKYERKKEARCKETPGEVAAKQELTQALRDHREKLPKDKDRNPFYRSDGIDYLLEEKVKARKVDDGSDD